MHTSHDLQTKREHIIRDLNKKISVLNWDVSIVFDGTFQMGAGSRSHYNRLEILFTAEGETADEFILNELKSSPNPRLETVVTSDKTLAWYARRRHAQTESIEEFVFRLNKIYKNKIKQAKKHQSSLSESLVVNLPKLIAPQTSSQPSLLEKKAEWTLDDYEKIFETEFQQLMQEEALQVKPKDSAMKRKPRTPKRKKSVFDEPSIDKKGSTQMERWLKIFEDKFNEENRFDH
jgi:predicted RNA-binding protein with PIN domain